MCANDNVRLTADQHGLLNKYLASDRNQADGEMVEEPLLKCFFQMAICTTHIRGKQDRREFCIAIDPSQKSHNASYNYPTMHHFVTDMCTHVHISVTKCSLWDMAQMHFWICEMGLFPCLRLHHLTQPIGECVTSTLLASGEEYLLSFDIVGVCMIFL